MRLDGNQLYVGVYDNNLYALNAKTGEFLWKYPTDGGVVTRPFVYKGLVIFGSEDQVTYAVNTSGRLVWTCPTEGRVRSSPAVEFDHAFFGSDDHRLYAVNAQSGRVIWRFEATGPVRSSPILGDEMVYVGSEDGHVYAMDMSSGKSRWKFRTNRGVTSSPAIYKDMVIVGSRTKAYTRWTANPDTPYGGPEQNKRSSPALPSRTIPFTLAALIKTCMRLMLKMAKPFGNLTPDPKLSPPRL